MRNRIYYHDLVEISKTIDNGDTYCHLLHATLSEYFHHPESQHISSDGIERNNTTRVLELVNCSRDNISVYFSVLVRLKRFVMLKPTDTHVYYTTPMQYGTIISRQSFIIVQVTYMYDCTKGKRNISILILSGNWLDAVGQ